jgi:hypothetical protein
MNKILLQNFAKIKTKILNVYSFLKKVQNFFNKILKTKGLKTYLLTAKPQESEDRNY